MDSARLFGVSEADPEHTVQTEAGQSEQGQAAYTPLILRLYDWYVLGLPNHLV